MHESISKKAVASSAIQAVLQQLYSAFNTRNIDTVLAALHPDVDWPNAWERSRVHGRNAVRDYWTRQWAVLDPHVTPVAFTTDTKGRTIVEVHAVIRNANAKTLADYKVQHIYTFEAGLVRSMEIIEI
ncbi:MAG: nuclear transport factor 2 family protein [Acidobacteriota bacterium]|nr:nuclear transport factor 2 family protein [Acidobacteriota bacterium]